LRMRKKKNLAARLARCEALMIARPEALRGNWAQSLMPAAREVHVEIGCGKGKFIMETAQENPDVLFIGIERVPEALVIAMERVMDKELRNVVFANRDAGIIDMLFAGNEVDRVYLNFSDPWPKSKHDKRRLTHAGFLSLYRSVLKPGGQIHFRTDNLPLFEFSLEQFSSSGYALSEVTRDRHAGGIQGILTEYEEKFIRDGVKINRCVAILSPANRAAEQDDYSGR